jgi:aryl-alcohol dehydrogenase-like predicted oxidoreductase
VRTFQRAQHPVAVRRLQQFDAYDHWGNTTRITTLDAVAAGTGAAGGQVALAWLLSRGIKPIHGGSKPNQLDNTPDGPRSS